MRRFLILTLAVVAVVVLTAGAAPAAGQRVLIAVNAHESVDGELDLVVFTGYPMSMIAMDRFCFDVSGTFPVYAAAIRDSTAGQAGRVTGVAASTELKAGTRIRDMMFYGECLVVPGSTIYRIYEGYTE